MGNLVDGIDRKTLQGNNRKRCITTQMTPYDRYSLGRAYDRLG